MSIAVWAKDLKIVIPFQAGGSTDQISRELRKAIENQGINSTIEYKIGAGGLNAMNYLSLSSEPALLIIGPSVLVLPILQKENVKYNLNDNIHFVGLVGIEPTYVVTNAKNNIKLIKDLDNLIPNFINYGTPGIGTSSALSADSIFSDTNKITIVNYKGGSDALQAVLKNEVHVIADSELIVGSHIVAGSLRPLAVISPFRTKTFPEVPTLREINSQKFDSVGIYRWQGVFVNSHVSKEVIDIIKSMLKDGLLRDRYSTMGFFTTPKLEENFIDRESKKINFILNKKSKQ